MIGEGDCGAIGGMKRTCRKKGEKTDKLVTKGRSKNGRRTEDEVEADRGMLRKGTGE
jgi:hypothetical protein